jgi:hypothetical protein
MALGAREPLFSLPALGAVTCGAAPLNRVDELALELLQPADHHVVFRVGGAGLGRIDQQRPGVMSRGGPADAGVRGDSMGLRDCWLVEGCVWPVMRT